MAKTHGDSGIMIFVNVRKEVRKALKHYSLDAHKGAALGC
jgi:hypothetical protein